MVAPRLVGPALEALELALVRPDREQDGLRAREARQRLALTPRPQALPCVLRRHWLLPGRAITAKLALKDALTTACPQPPAPFRVSAQSLSRHPTGATCTTTRNPSLISFTVLSGSHHLQG